MANLLRLTRLALYFLLGILLGSVVVVAHAETINASTEQTVVDPIPTASRAEAGILYDVTLMTITAAKSRAEGFAQQVCGGNPVQWGTPWTSTLMTPTAQQFQRGYGCTSSSGHYARAMTNGSCPSNSTYDAVAGCKKTTYVCPTGQGWVLSGMTCTRPDCAADEVRDSSGVCSCPTGKTRIGEICVTLCPTGYHVRTPDNGQCEKDCFGDQRQANNGTCECEKGKKSYFSGSMNQTANLQGAGDCQNGCTVKAGFFSLPAGVVGVATAGSVSQWITPTTTTGAACQGSATTGTVKVTLPPPAPVPTPTPEQPADPKNTPTNNADPENCSGSGGVYMTVNGQGKCATPGPDNMADAQKLTSGQKTTSTTNPDGTVTDSTVKTTTTTNPHTGETSTSSTTTTTTKDANGNVTGTGTTTTNGTGDQGGKNGDGTKGFCQENPQSPICKKSSWTGDCDNAPVCDGDAVQCATAKAVWEHRCVMKWAEKDNDLSNGIDKDNLFGDQAKIDAALNKDGTKDFDILATFQAKRQNYLTFASSCNPDLSFDFKGVHYTFDTTALCQIGMVVKVLLHLAAYMALIRILTVKLF